MASKRKDEQPAAMDAEQRKGAILMLRETIAAVEAGRVEWLYLGYKTESGTTIKVRSERAPTTLRMPP